MGLHELHNGQSKSNEGHAFATKYDKQGERKAVITVASHAGVFWGARFSSLPGRMKNGIP